jgi:LuxR family maltose regulon positive regulatory protein
MMDTLASPLILTKLRVPTVRARVIPRMHLVERLSAETDTGLILVCAPAGYGKTTLLAEWSQSLLQHGVAVAWYALDSSDDAPTAFGSYLVASLAQALGPMSELAHMAQLVRSSPEIDLQRILPAVINAVASSDRDCVLILDDYHLIGAPAIHTAIAFLLERLPENMHVAIGSRSDPPLHSPGTAPARSAGASVARLRVRGQLLEIRADSLRFTTDETALFLNEVMRLELSPEMVTALDVRTEGWIAGLQLAALSLSGRSDKESFISSFTGSHRYLVEYLLEEVVGRQSEEVQSFLLSTSILERLCGPLCDAILGGPLGSEAVLQRLEQANVFVVALDDQGYWYRYHHLFRDFLQTRLLKTRPERVAPLHRAASEWHAAHGSLREAVQHALQTQDWTYAAALVEQHGVSMMMHSEFSTVYEWCAAFPEEVMRVHPALCLFQSNALVLGYRRQNRGRIEERLQMVEQAAAALEDRQLAHLLIGQAATTRTFLATMTQDPAVDPREHFALTQRALDLLSEDDPARSAITLTIGYAHMALHDAVAGYQAMEEARQLSLTSHNYFGVVEATFHQARLAHNQGQLRRAAEICRQGKADIAAVLADPDHELPAVGCLDIALGCILLEQDRLEEAEQDLLRGLDRIWGMNPYYQMTACVALFRLREIQDRPAEAVEFLSRLEETWPDFAFCARALRVMHALRAAPDDPDTLAARPGRPAWCQTFSSSPGEDMPPPGMGPFGAAEAYYLAYLAWARAQIATGNAQAAWSYLKRQLNQAEAHGLTNRVIELSLLEAQARRAQGDNKRTWAALERALVAAQPEGYLRIFDQGAALNRLLVEAANRGISRDYMGRILAVIGMPGAAARSSQAPYLESGEHLTGRELEVLRLMAQGASNLEIAEQLVITVGTVKSHINHILGKLDAHNRTEAVARARGLGLLDI